MRHRKLACWVLLLLGLFATQTPVLDAQVSTGSIAGVVTDQTGAVIPGARVVLESEATGQQRSTETGTTGAYLFPLVPPGRYTVQVEAPGFQSYVARGLEVQVNQAVTHDVQLIVGETATRVEVVAATPVLDQRTATVGQVIDRREVVDLPLNARNFLELARLAPAVAELPGSSQSTGLAVNGQRANQIGFYFDGVDSRTEERGKPAFTPSIEAIQEFKIQQNSFSAEFGRSPAAINLSLRSGGNDFHGSLFEFLRNDVLDARSFFSPTVDPLRRSQFGAVLSGPIVRNRAFFMANYEGLRTRRARTLFHSVPTSEQRQGDFSRGPQIFDPFTLDRQTRRRQPFPGNLIPRSRFGRMGTAALKYYPEPNVPSEGGYNYLVRNSATDDGDQIHGRIDHQFSETDTLFARYSYSRNDSDSPAGLPLTGSISKTKAHNITVQQTHTFGPTSINQLRLAWIFYDSFSGFPLAERNLAAEEFGLKNLSPPSTAFGLPQINVVGLTTIGANPFAPQGPRENIYTVADDFSWIRGRHSMKFGFDGRSYRPAGRVQVTPNGSLTFENRFTNQPGVSGTGSAVADLLLGVPWSGRGTLLVESNGWVSLKHHYLGFYAQDEIRLSRNLTLNLGLRYEYQTPYKERFKDLAIFDYVNWRFLELGRQIDSLNVPDRNNFAPRAGLAWTVTPRTVIRAGAGVFYGHPRGAEFTSFQLSPPYVLDMTLVSDPLIPDLAERLFPRPEVRDPSTREILLSPNTNVFSLDRYFRTNYTIQWNLTIQRELAPNWLFEIGYLGNGAHKLTGRDLPNQAFLDPDPINNPTPVITRRPNPNIGDVNMVKSLDNSNYHAMAAKLEKRFSGGLSMLGAFTYSKVMGIGGALFGDQSRTQDARNRRAEYAPLEFNQKLRFTLAWIYELPFGSGRRWLNNTRGPAQWLVGGWSFQGALTAHSGFPLTPTDTVSSNVGRQDMNRPDRVCDGNLPAGNRSINRWFDTSCFVPHLFGRFGNSGNGVIIGPGVNTVNLTLMKNFALAERTSGPVIVQFRGEFYNAFNHPSFGDPNLSTGTRQFGVIRSTRVGGREVQLALKLLF